MANTLSIIRNCQLLRAHKENLSELILKYDSTDKAVLYTENCINKLEHSLFSIDPNYLDIFNNWQKNNQS